MRGLRIVALTLLIFLASSVASVYANTGEANLGLPILGTTGAPALAAPSLYTGFINVLYADGTPVVLEANHVALGLCNTDNSNSLDSLTLSNNGNPNATTGCVLVAAMLKQTAPGSYTYSFTPPALVGTVTIFVKAYGLADDNGRIFPSVDTSIGTYAYTPSPSSTSVPPASSVPPSTSPPPTATAPTPVAPLTSQAVSTNPTPTKQASPIEPLLLALSTLAVAGVVLVFFKRQ